MSYNLLLDTGFNYSDKHWRFTNCKYENGYLIATDKLFSMEQKISLTSPTKLYCSFDCIVFNKDIKQVYVGIQQGEVVETSVKKPSRNKRNRVSVICNTDGLDLSVKFIAEAVCENAKIYIDSPLLVDLNENKKAVWSKPILDKILDYRVGFEYTNLYHESEFTIHNTDIKNCIENPVQGNCGVILFVDNSLSIPITFHGIYGHRYLIKIDYLTVNDYGSLELTYGDLHSTQISTNQDYLLVDYLQNNEIIIKITNTEVMPYIINLRHILVSDVTYSNLDIDDIPYMPYI